MDARTLDPCRPPIVGSRDFFQRTTEEQVFRCDWRSALDVYLSAPDPSQVTLTDLLFKLYVEIGGAQTLVQSHRVRNDTGGRVLSYRGGGERYVVTAQNVADESRIAPVTVSWCAYGTEPVPALAVEDDASNKPQQAPIFGAYAQSAAGSLTLATGPLFVRRASGVLTTAGAAKRYVQLVSSLEPAVPLLEAPVENVGDVWNIDFTDPHVAARFNDGLYVGGDLVAKISSTPFVVTVDAAAAFTGIAEYRGEFTL